MLKRLIIRSVILLYKLQANFITHSKDRFNLALGRDKLIYAEQAGYLPVAKNIERVAVVALYPNKNILPFIVNLMDGLANNGFFVLGVSPKKLSSEISEPLRAHCHMLLECFPIGRDFGSYKVGINWIKRQPYLANMNTLALVNDSLYYPQHINKSINDLMSLDGNWLGLYENYQMGRHVQSFFEIFRGDALKSENFKNFWNRYKPFSSRLHCINKGEKGLTKALILGGFTPSVLYNSASLKKEVYKNLTCDNINTNFYEIIRSSLGSFNKKIYPSYTLNFTDGSYLSYKGKKGKFDCIFSSEEMKCLYAEQNSTIISYLAENYNPTHGLGLLINFLYQAPIKRDLCLKWERHTFSEILFMCCGFTDSEKELMQIDLRSRGNVASLVLLSRQWFKFHSGIE